MLLPSFHSQPHGPHPCEEDPARWRAAHKPCFDRWGHFCLYRNSLGILCGRADGEPYWRIWWCGRWPIPWRYTTRLDLDHVVPVSVDYEVRWAETNFQPLCHEHNLEKGTKTIDFRIGRYPTALRMCGTLLAYLLSVVPFTRFGSPAYEARRRYAAHYPG